MSDRRTVKEPEVTPSILDTIPDCLKEVLLESVKTEGKGRRSVLISANNLANRFILSRWGIRPSHRQSYNDLFTTIRKYCRDLFNHHLLRGRIECTDGNGKHLFGVYKFDEVQGNLILGFILLTNDSDWTLSRRK